MPFIRSSFLSLGYAVICERPDPLPECYSEELRSLILSMLTKNYVSRPSIAQIHDVIRRRTAIEPDIPHVLYPVDQPFLLRPPSSMRLVNSLGNIALNHEEDNFELRVVGGTRIFDDSPPKKQQEDAKQAEHPEGVQRHRETSKIPTLDDIFLCSCSLGKDPRGPKSTERVGRCDCGSCHESLSKSEFSRSDIKPSCFLKVPAYNFERLHHNSTTPNIDRKGGTF